MTNNSLVIIPHPSYSLALTPCDLILFLKLKLKGWHFEILSDIRKEPQLALDSIKEHDFHGDFEAWKNDGIAVYISKEMTTKIE